MLFRKNNKQQVLEEAKTRLDKLITQNFRAIAKELHGHEVYLYIRAVSPGFQEFIEALTFYEYLSETPHSDWEHLQEKLMFEDENNPEDKFSLHLIPSEFILGFADLTGKILIDIFLVLLIK